ncbi:MAG: T9SS type A sorting domain-containing protein [Candidatus Fermentibacteraceae bacterium]|nr:T9SS type A sorting domain-containing protein [Candidatus Fermentibacteraceae bacterium]MBN2607568.1 T9SS type A sorting domain-containing protein [Candidatus Fermentibacteraceae bacterium]
MMDSYYGDGYDMVHQHDQTIWSCGYKYLSPNYMGVASVSHDAGATWTRHVLYSGTDYGYIRAIAVDPDDPDRVFCLGYENGSYRLYHTLNGGTSWTGTAASGYTGTPCGMAICPDNGNLIAAASSSGLYSSSNAGATWTKVTTAFSGANDLMESTIFEGLLIATVNQGVWLWEDWTGAPVQVGSDLGHPDVACLAESSDYLYAGTDGGAAWRSYNGTGIGEQGPGSQTATALSAAPNPARGFSVLSFDLPSQQVVELALYDITGRRVLSVVEGMMDQGRNSVTVDTSVLSPGMYFARLTTGEGPVTARMIVTR